ncbi:MAG: Nif3-like dinuclear metal center hexameric protein, partial [Spirochaetota bacterium]
MVPREELERWLNDFFNIHQISDYLPNGLQIEGREEVRRIVTGVSINYELIQKAASQKADAIIVHHGMFWKNENPVIRGYRKKRIKQLLECEINLFAYHLPLDEHPEISHNRLILEKLDVDSIEKVQTPPGKYATGLKGTFQMLVPFEKLVDRTNQGLNTRARYFQYGSSEIGSVFIISGGGKNELENA